LLLLFEYLSDWSRLPRLAKGGISSVYGASLNFLTEVGAQALVIHDDLVELLLQGKINPPVLLVLQEELSLKLLLLLEEPASHFRVK